MKYKIAFFLILVVAIFLRFIKLGSLPAGLTWDEAAIGYNAYGLITNHRDEWLKRTPIVFQSFGDFKSPLLIYTTVFPVALFGLTPFAVRLPTAIAGVGVVIISYMLTALLTKDKKSALVVMALTALSPWAVHYSRMGFESMLACFFVSLGTLCVLYWVGGKKFWYLVFGFFALALSLYAYHSAKVFVPLLMLILAVIARKKIWAAKREVLIAGMIFLATLLPLGYATVFGKANARAMSTTLIGKPDAATQFVKNYSAHLTPAFLLHGKDVTYRHSNFQVGIFYPLELVLGVGGVLLIITRKHYRQYWWIPVLFFIGLIPAGLGLDVPHSNRALLSFFWLEIAAGIGIVGIWHWATGYGKKSFGVWILVFGILIHNSLGYAQAYRSTYGSSVALKDIGYGYEELMEFVRPLEGGIERVYFTNSYGQAYIYILFFKRLTPMEYQHGGLANYTIANDPWKEAREKKNVLVVGTDVEIPDDATVIKEIRYPDGNIAFQVARR